MNAKRDPNVDLAVGMITAGEPHRSHGIRQLTSLARAGNTAAGCALADALVLYCPPGMELQAEGWAAAAHQLGHCGPLEKLIGDARLTGDRRRLARLKQHLASNAAEQFNPETKEPAAAPKPQYRPEPQRPQDRPQRPAATGAAERASPPPPPAPARQRFSWAQVSTVAIFGIGVMTVLALALKPQDDPAPASTGTAPAITTPKAAVVPTLIDQPPTVEQTQQLTYPAQAETTRRAFQEAAAQHTALAQHARQRGDFAAAETSLALAVAAALNAGDLDLAESLLGTVEQSQATKSDRDGAWRTVSAAMAQGVRHEIRTYDGARLQTNSVQRLWAVSPHPSDPCRATASVSSNSLTSRFFARYELSSHPEPRLTQLADMSPDLITEDMRSEVFFGSGRRYERDRNNCASCQKYLLFDDGFAMSFYDLSSAQHFQRNLDRYLSLNGCR